jgi:hypothetical protein
MLRPGDGTVRMGTHLDPETLHPTNSQPNKFLTYRSGWSRFVLAKIGFLHFSEREDGFGDPCCGTGFVLK